MSKTYAVHYGYTHILRCRVLDDDFDELDDAREAAQKLVEEGYAIVVVADTDGNEWDFSDERRGLK